MASGGDAAGFFFGRSYGVDFIPISDISLKDSIEDINGDSALSVLSELMPKKYIFKRDSFPFLNLPSGLQFGLIAQQVDSICTN